MMKIFLKPVKKEQVLTQNALLNTTNTVYLKYIYTYKSKHIGRTVYIPLQDHFAFVSKAAKLRHKRNLLYFRLVKRCKIMFKY